MAQIGSLVYISVQDFKDNTPRSDQTTLSDAEITTAVIQAQIQIDSYIGHIVPYEEDQPYKFPTKDDNEASYIPDDIKMACVYIASDILNNNVNALSNNDNAQKETWSDTGYSVDYGSNQGASENATLSMPQLAKKLLLKYKTATLPSTY